jgi:long-chain acyl-CoA synthetase
MLDSLGQILPSSRKYGCKTALVIKDRSYNFEDLYCLSSRLANGLNGLGVRRGQRVTLYSQNCLEWIVSYYAIARLGAVINPINVMLTPEETLFVVNDCEANTILTSAHKSGPLLDLKKDSSLDNVVVYGGPVPSGAISFESLVLDGRPDFSDITVGPESLSTIGYTSGTTGYPKGAMLSHRSVVLNSAMTANMHVRTAADTVVTSLPCAHVYGNVVMNGAFMNGMTLVLLERFNETEILAAVERHGATMLEGVPTMFMYLLNCPDLEKYDLSSLTRCTVGGQSMPVARMQEVEERFGCPLLELWGMTEIAGLGTTHPFYGSNRHGSIGIPIPTAECRIADVDDPSVTRSADQVGELLVRGPIVMQGYYGNDRASSETIEADGWMHTGDLGRVDSDGYIYIVDRKKDMILTGGYNIYPAELDRVIAGHPAVAMVAVGKRTDAIKGEIAKAYVVLKKGMIADESEILSYCRQHLAAYKMPREVQFVEDLPKTSTGKILRRDLNKLDA